MTIASEITRLQNDKAAICTAIENKGVTVGAVTLDSYASCIDAISSGGGKSVCFLMVGGGGGGGGGSSGSYGYGGGGGAGGVRIGKFTFVSDINVTIGSGGVGGTCNNQGCNGGDSSIVDVEVPECCVISHGGGGGGAGIYKNTTTRMGKDGGSGGGSGGGCYSLTTGYICGGKGIYGLSGEMGTRGGDYTGGCCGAQCNVGSGGGGATGSGMGNPTFYCGKCCCEQSAGWGGKGLEGEFGGAPICIAGGGGGGVGFSVKTCNRGCGMSGGGNGGWGKAGFSATTCGSGGGGAGTCNVRGGDGAGGLVIIGYNCECKDCNGFTCATGGNSCYVCDGMKYHCFTSSGTFTIVS